MRVRASWRNVAVEEKEGEGNSSRLYALTRALTARTKNAKFFSVFYGAWLSLLSVNKDDVI